MTLFQAYMVGVSRLALIGNTEYLMHPPPSSYVQLHLILLPRQRLETSQIHDLLFWEQVMACAAGDLVSVEGMDDSKHEVPCVHVGGDTCIVGDFPLDHLVACDAALVREEEDKDRPRLGNGDGTPDALHGLRKTEAEEGEVDQKLLGCKVPWASEREAMIAELAAYPSTASFVPVAMLLVSIYLCHAVETFVEL